MPDITEEANVINADGDLDRLWTPVGLVALGDAVHVEGGFVEVEPDRYAEAFNDPKRRVTSSGGLLKAFVRLPVQPRSRVLHPDRVRDFAARWGLLDACTHGLWFGHGPMDLPVAFGSPSVRLPVGRDCKALVGREPLDLWGFWVEQAGAILRLINGLREPKPEPSRDVGWDVLMRPGPWVAPEVADRFEHGDHRPPGHHEAQRFVIAAAIMAWTALGGVSLGVSWQRQTSASLMPVSRSLLGSLGLQLGFVATGRDRWWECSHCGIWYVPNGKPRFDQRNYCDKCRDDRVSRRLAHAKSNAKRRAQRLR